MTNTTNADTNGTEQTTNEKGERNEREAANILARVYGKSTVDKIDRYGTNDPFGFVDVMAIKQGKKVLYVQVKTNRFTAKDRRQYGSKARHKLPHDHAQFEVWVRVDYEGWRIHRYDPDTDRFELYAELPCNTSDAGDQFRSVRTDTEQD